MPKVSVITPIYNQANFINCAIRSLQRQSFGDWEHIIVDDGSTDSIYETLRPYETDIRVRIIHNYRNLGLGAALNIGIECAINAAFSLFVVVGVLKIQLNIQEAIVFDSQANWERTKWF